MGNDKQKKPEEQPKEVVLEHLDGYNFDAIRPVVFKAVKYDETDVDQAKAFKLQLGAYVVDSAQVMSRAAIARMFDKEPSWVGYAIDAIETRAQKHASFREEVIKTVQRFNVAIMSEDDEEA